MSHAPAFSDGASKALNAHQDAKDASQRAAVVDGSDITSLNKLLQWSTAHVADKPAATAVQSALQEKSDVEQRADREWLDAAFPDMYAGVRDLIAQLEQFQHDAACRVDALEGLQEFFVDLNYAINIDKIGALKPVLKCADDTDATVRAAAIWVLATAMQHLQDVKDLLAAHGTHALLARRLADSAPPVRAKAVSAASALLNGCPEHMRAEFAAAGGSAALRDRLFDVHAPTRRRARFFLQHAPHSGNADFVRAVVADRNILCRFADSLADTDATDVTDVEAAVGALGVLADEDVQRILQVAPELPSALDGLAARCVDADLKDLVLQAVSRLG